MTELVELGLLTDADRAELEGDEVDPFDGAGTTVQFRPKDRHVALRDDEGRLIASAGLTLAEVEVSGARLPVVGIGGVIVNAAHRGRGLARTVVTAALERAAATGRDFAVLFCHPDRMGLYERLGFQVVDEPVIVRQPDGYAPMTMRTMWRPLRTGARWPAGRPILHALPF